MSRLKGQGFTSTHKENLKKSKIKNDELARLATKMVEAKTNEAKNSIYRRMVEVVGESYK